MSFPTPDSAATGTRATTAGAALFTLAAGAALLAPADALAIPGERPGAPAPTPAGLADRERGITLPKRDVHYARTRYYAEDIPDGDYVHASPAAHEAFRDIKFSIRIHWGVYAKVPCDASWPFLWYSNQKKDAYNELYKTFNPVRFDAERWMQFFKRCGMQAFAFTTKHHDGFSMFHTKTRVKQRVQYTGDGAPRIVPCDTTYSIADTPFKRDIVKELCDAAHKNDIKIDLYFSHPDWFDADFRPYNSHPLMTENEQQHPHDFGHDRRIGGRRTMTPEPTAEERARMVARHREQLREILTNYGKIDMVCLDQWLGKDVWPETRETVKLMRQWSPDTLFRCRGIGNYGDYFQPEGFVPGAKENTNMPWMAICKLARWFSYDPEAKRYRGAPWVIKNLVDCVAKGGSFMVCIGPDEFGEFHPEAVRQLEQVGDWLRVNGEGIYNTRSRLNWREGEAKKSDKKNDAKPATGSTGSTGTVIKYTQTKDKKFIYGFFENWPADGVLTLKTFRIKPGSRVTLLGAPDAPITWTQPATGGTAKITLPAALTADPAKRPCQTAWALKFEVQP